MACIGTALLLIFFFFTYLFVVYFMMIFSVTDYATLNDGVIDE
jgi:hypothetical protein